VTKLYIAGANGFIGTHLKEYVLKNTDWKISTILDSPDYIVHLAGHSQIDRSIKDPVLVNRDIETTMQLLECAREITQLKKFLYFSSDEVFGPKEVIEDFRPNDRHNPYSPYAAGKSACESLCMAWARTYNVPTTITHCQNLFGERQPANKFLPTVVRCALRNEPVPIYAPPSRMPNGFGKRDFLHVRDACSAIMMLLDRGWSRQKYNISPDFDYTPEYIVGLVSIVLEKDIKTTVREYSGVRPGFFLEHGLNGNKLKELGWERRALNESIEQTVRWLIQPENRHWLGL
jgi:dTDP-glucose 4,6-dehydratase